MTGTALQKITEGQAYNFLRDDKRLAGSFLMLAPGGSHAYGTAVEGSDIDLRGVAFNTKENLMSGNDFEHVQVSDPDTTLYSLEKAMRLFSACNPNTIELLGLEDWQYAYLSPEGKELLKHKKLFLSQRAAYSFGGYAHQQMLRLSNKSARKMPQAELEEHIAKSIRHAMQSFESKYAPLAPGSSLDIHVGDANKAGFDKEILFDGTFKDYPLRDFSGMVAEMTAVTRAYEKAGSRNEKAMSAGKLGKHMLHLVRLHCMVFDILEREEIRTYRRDERDFLLEIRNGKFLDDNGLPTQEFYDLARELEKRLEYAEANTSLPRDPNMEKIRELHASLNWARLTT